MVSAPAPALALALALALVLVLAGKGVAILPACAQIGRPPGVVFRALRNVDARMEIAACWRSDWDSPLIEPFLVCARAALRESV
jgi:DNA-binding transcriptional LysR family regulator